MLERIKRLALPCLGLMLGLTLAACGNLSPVNRDGQADTLVWAEPDQATLVQGTYPDPRHLAMVRAGMTKDQLYQLLGRPHFLEGFVMVREWDYLFHLETPSGEQTCQYKVLFDQDVTARSFHWREPSCAAAAQAAARLGAS